MPRSQSTRSRVLSLAHAWPVACGAILVITPLRPANLECSSSFLHLCMPEGWPRRRVRFRDGNRHSYWGRTSSVARHCNFAPLAQYYLVAILSSCSLPDGPGPASSTLETVVLGRATPTWFGSAC